MAGAFAGAFLALAAPTPADALVALPPPPDVVARPELLARPARMAPVPGAMTGWFGERRGGRSHDGVDFDAEVGDPVFAAAAGTVAWAGPAPQGMAGYGTVVIVDHGLGVETISAHLSSVAVSAGQTVWPGDHVGSVGMTGHVTGSHLHFELRRHGVPDDAVPWLHEVPEARSRRVL